MAWRILINGVDRTTQIRQANGVTVDLSYNERGTARFATRSGYIPGLREEVLIYDKDGITPIFGGIIYERQTESQFDQMFTICECVDFSVFLSWRSITGGYVGNKRQIERSTPGSPGTITTVQSHGLTTGDTVHIVGHASTPPLDEVTTTATVTGADTFTIPVAITVGEAIEGDEEGVGTMQRLTVVSLKRVLHDLCFYYLNVYGITLDPSQVEGPSGAGPGLLWEDATADDILRDLTKYSGGYLWSISPYKVLSMSLPTLATPSAPFAITDDNSTARLLEWSETSEYYATKVILRCGGTGTRKLRQTWLLDAAIAAAGYVETDVPSTPTGGVRAWISVAPSGAESELTVGAAGQQLLWNWETHRLTAGTYVPAFGDLVTLEYTAQYPFIVTADSGLSPPVERAEDRTEILDRLVGQELANHLLAAAIQSPRTFEIESVIDGLRPGQVIGIQSSYRSTIANALITRVTIQLMTNDLWTYRASATTGTYQGSGLDFWRERGSRGGGALAVPAVTYTSGINPATPVAIVGEALTEVDDTNVTLTLGGTPATALLAATSLTLGWTGTLAAGRLNSNVVQSVVDDSNVTGDIAAQTLTLGWFGQLPVTRGGTGVAAVGTGRVLYGANTAPLASSANLTFDGTALNSHTLNVTTGNLSLAASAHPTVNYHSNLGMLSRKYLTLHAAELWVETLVAQNTMATIGGRVLVAPTTLLTEDFPAAATTIHVKHNNLANGDRVYLESGGRVEWIAVTSGATGGATVMRYHPLVGLSSRSVAATYAYTVTRNLDNTDADDWYAGDAVLNTGTTGKGYIDLYSLSGVLSGSGPTIAGNVRTGTTYSDVATRWAIGNLDGLYGYSGTTWGAAFGDNSNAWLKIDSTNGIRLGHNATTFVEIDAAGNATFAGQVTIGTGRNQLSNSFGSPVVRFTTPDGNGTDWGQTFTNSGLTITAGVNHGTYRVQNSAAVPTNGSTWMTLAGTPAAGTVSVWWGPTMPVAAGQMYEWSFYAGVQNAGNLVARLDWLDNAGSVIGVNDSAVPVTASYAGGWTLAEWGRTGVIATAPTGTTQVRLEAVQTHTAQANPFTFLIRLFFGEAQSGQTALSPWAPGGQTLITGDSIATDFISASTIRSSGASALSTGTGFWMDASTATPTFRVGNPAANHVTWNGSTLTLAGVLSAATGTFAGSLSAATGTFAGSLSAATGTFTGSITGATGTFGGTTTLGATGITITPADSGDVFVDTQSYKFTVTDGNLSVTGADGPSNGRWLRMESRWTHATPRNTVVQLSAKSPTKTALVSVVANEAANTFVRLSADDFRWNTTTSATAGAIVGYLNVYVNETARKLAIYAVS